MNLYRRHLDASQRGMVSAALIKPFEDEAKERQEATQAKTGKKVGAAKVAVNLPEPKKEEAKEEKAKSVKEQPKDETGKFIPSVENLPPTEQSKATDKAGEAVGVSGRSIGGKFATDGAIKSHWPYSAEFFEYGQWLF